MNPPKTIIIAMEGGLIQWIEGIPEDVRIIVRDYDVKGADPNDLSRDEDGDECFVSEWEHQDSENA
jgi:hypothetical protein